LLLVVLVLDVLVLPLAAAAQPAAKVTARIGFIGNTDPKTQAPHIDALRIRLRDLGWIEGKNLTIEYRWAKGIVERLPTFAEELVRLKVDIIVTSGAPAVRAAQKATSTIPIVFAALLTDPVALGFAASLARPGGNITGLTSQYEEIITKHVQLLSETVPGISRLALLRHTSMGTVTEKPATAAAGTLGIKVQALVVGDVSELEGAFNAMRKARAQALLVLPSPFFNAHRTNLIKLAASYRLPAFYEFRDYVEDGGLMSYSPSLPDMYRRAASYVDRILKGTKPGDIPIERASTFEFVVNMKTAKALGLTIPQSVLFRVDQLIQ
jgi:putative ABC transport system substrate-binding protein